MPKKPIHIYCLKILLQGVVQGVGFRPYVYRLANQFNLKGTVCNNNQGVEIFIEGETSTVKQFLFVICSQIPSRSRIDKIETSPWPLMGYDDFRILKSKTGLNEITGVSPDIAVCDDCLKDMESQFHRINYPFINCTNCGPRFSIIKDIPYDREKTTMNDFEMCEICKSEYSNVADRRYHAQPIACNHCGPQYTFCTDHEIITHYPEIIKKVVSLLKSDEIVAIKGIGGFHLACSALSEIAVRKLRNLKKREEKPLAVMFPDIESVEKYLDINSIEKEILESWRRPIVILKQKKPLVPSITSGLKTLGVFLPYMPANYAILKEFASPIVLTSGNISKEPICTSNDQALEKLAKITSHFVIHNREIENRVDDSVVRIINNKIRIFRRSRGYCPEPLNTNHYLEGIFASGAEMESSFAIGKGNSAILSQYIGDLKNYETTLFYKESVKRFHKLFRFRPELVVSDLHPDYWSSQYVKQLHSPIIQVQHHHAHIAACMAENNLDEKVIGIAFDGTGYGTDGNIWGGEFFLADLNNFKRISHFDYFMLPGGDQAVKEPWRIAVSILQKYYGDSSLEMKLPFLKEIPQKELNLVVQVLKKKINSPLTSSVGRLFDAVSALTGLCMNSTFQAQAPMLLESSIDLSVKDSYAVSGSNPINLKEMFDGIIKDIQNKVQVSKISARFHNTLVEIVLSQVERMAGEFKVKKVVLSGGCFQNAYLLSELENKLIQKNYQVYSHTTVPANDGGIALGQLVVAAKRREMKCV